MKVVVTGASGHLGSYLVAELLESGHEVVAASRASAPASAPFGRALTKQARALALDVTQDAAVATLRAELGPEVALVHLAAFHPPATASFTFAQRKQLLETNVYGTMRVLEAARRSEGRPGVACVVYASSFEVYGELEGAAPITEEARVTPITDYGATKLAGEDHLLAFAYEEQTPTSALRLPAIYGPGEHTPRALPNFLAQVARGQRPTIFGDGADLRDQIHARDAALAVVCALETRAHGLFNVADGQPHSIAELARTAMQLAGMQGEPERKLREKARRDYHMSIERARRELGFEPRITLREGMAEQLAWLRSRPA